MKIDEIKKVQKKLEGDNKKRRCLFCPIWLGVSAVIAGTLTPILLAQAGTGIAPTKNNDNGSGGTNPTPSVSYQYDLASTGLTDLNSLYLKAGTTNEYTNVPSEADGYIPAVTAAPNAYINVPSSTPGSNPTKVELNQSGHAIASGTPYDSSKWIIQTKTQGHGAIAAGTKDVLTVAKYSDDNPTVPYTLTTMGTAETLTKWEVTPTEVKPSGITLPNTNSKTFLGLQLPSSFDGVAYASLTDAQKEQLVKLAISEGVMSLEAVTTGGHTGTKIHLDLNKALDNTLADGSADTLGPSLASASAGATFYKKLEVTSGTPTPMGSTNDIDALATWPSGVNQPYTNPHNTIIGSASHNANTIPELKGVYYSSLFESVLGLLSYYDKKFTTITDPTSDFSMLWFGYGLSYYKLSYKYDSISLTEASKVFPAVIENSATPTKLDDPLLPKHTYLAGSAAGQTETDTVYNVWYNSNYSAAFEFDLPYTDPIPAEPTWFQPSMYIDGAGHAEQIPAKATVATTGLTATSTLTVWINGTKKVITTKQV